MKTYIDTVVTPQQDTSTSNPLTFHANMDDFDVSSSEEEAEDTKNPRRTTCTARRRSPPFCTRRRVRAVAWCEA